MLLRIFFIVCLYYGTCFADNNAIKEERKTFIVTGASGELGSATANYIDYYNHFF